MVLSTKILYWLTWLLQSALLVLSWLHFLRLGAINEQASLSLRRTMQQCHSEILLMNRLDKIVTSPIKTVVDDDHRKRSTTLLASNLV